MSRSVERSKQNRLISRAMTAFSLVLDRHSQEIDRLSVRSQPYFTTVSPGISFVWTTDDLLRRTVRLAFEGDQIPRSMVVGIDAEKAVLEEDGSGERYVRCEILSELTPPFRRRTMEKVLNHAFSTVSSWKSEDLDNTIIVCPSAASINREAHPDMDGRGILPRLEYLPTSGNGNIHFKNRPVHYATEINPYFLIGYDEKGEVVDVCFRSIPKFFKENQKS